MAARGPAGWIRVPVLAADHVHHQLDQVVLGRHVVVQRHRGDTEFASHSAHRHRVQSPGVRQPDRRGRDRYTVVLALRAARTSFRDIPDGNRRQRGHPLPILKNPRVTLSACNVRSMMPISTYNVRSNGTEESCEQQTGAERGGAIAAGPATRRVMIGLLSDGRGASAARTPRWPGRPGAARRVRVVRRTARELPPARCGVALVPRLEVPGADGVTC